MRSILSKVIKYHRKQSGLTQAELADLSGVGKTAIFDLEKGNGNPRLETVENVLKVLNIQIQFLSPLMEDFNLVREPS
jgi:HTH-type transcriptional regulator/antitoxin HipB